MCAAHGGGFKEIITIFGSEIEASDGGVDRKKLGERVFANPVYRKKLEAILHPLVRQNRDQFLQKQRRLGSQIVVLDVPLLYETGGDALCDYVIAVYAGEETIRKRALSRPGMTSEKLSGILATQMPPNEKCQRADFVLNTDLDAEITCQHLFAWLNQITAKPDMSKRQK